MKILKTIVLAAAFCFGAAQAHACRCVPEASVEQQAARYELVFAGTASQSIDPTTAAPKQSIWQRLQFWKPAPPPPVGEFVQLETRFQNITVLKGEQASEVTVRHHQPNGGLCGVSFQAGNEYLVLAWKNEDDTYGTSSCAIPQFSRAEFEAELSEAD